VHIADSAGGEGRNHSGCRGRWAEEEAPRKSGAAAGRGSVGTTPSTTAARGAVPRHSNNQGEERLLDVSVNVDRGGKILVSFPRRAGPAAAGVHGHGDRIGRRRLKADVVSEDRRLHGRCTFRWTGRQNVNSVTLEATDGRDRLRVNWDRDSGRPIDNRPQIENLPPQKLARAIECSGSYIRLVSPMR